MKIARYYRLSEFALQLSTEAIIREVALMVLQQLPVHAGMGTSFLVSLFLCLY